jgi:hypothetical protein
LKHILVSIACSAVLASTATAQIANYLGPGILTGGADNIGTRGGEQLDLRLFADVTGIYDNGFQPIAVDSKGNLVQVNGLYGLQADIGAYGVHPWRTAQLGLDYHGDFRHYLNDSSYDSSNHRLSLGYTYQKSKRLYFDLQAVAGTYSNYLGALPGEVGTATLVTSPNLLFDNRTYFLQGSAGLTYLLSARSSLSLTGQGFTTQYQSDALASVVGYLGRARYEYRVTRLTSVGAEYSRSHYAYPRYFGNSDLDNYNVFLATQIGRLWTFSLNGGEYKVHTLGLQTVALNPAIAALLGVYSTVHTYSATNWLPSGKADLTRKFKNGAFRVSYSRGASPGNGVFLTSQSDVGDINYTYTGVQRASFTIDGGYTSLSSIGQGIAPYRYYMGGVRLTYNLTHSLHAVLSYDVRQQEIQQGVQQYPGFKETAYRIGAGIAFSPGTVPLSLW